MQNVIVASTRPPKAPLSGGMAPAIREATAQYDNVIWYGLSESTDLGAGRVRSYNVEGRISAREIGVRKKDWDGHYCVLSNSVIWPDVHELPSLSTVFAEADYAGYKQVNRTLARQIKKDLGEDTKTPIFVQDYHHFILPEYLRQEGVKNSIIFFDHTPLPDPETLTPFKLRFYQGLMRSLLHADAANFQTAETARRAMQLMGIENPPMLSPFETRTIDCGNGHRIEIGHFPISINTKKVMKTAQEHQLSEKGRALASQLVAPFVFINFERCDYTKDIVTRLQAFEMLLENHPQLRGRVQITIGAEPTRKGIKAYDQHKDEVQTLATLINEKFPDAMIGDHLPVIFLNENFEHGDVLGLMRSDENCRKIGCVTPWRDGMNLVAKEYVAAQDASQAGVLVLSRGAGAAHELSRSALCFEPGNVEELYQQMLAAIRMPQPEANRRCREMQRHLETFDIVRWGRQHARQFDRISNDDRLILPRSPGRATQLRLVA